MDRKQRVMSTEKRNQIDQVSKTTVNKIKTDQNGSRQKSSHGMRRSIVALFLTLTDSHCESVPDDALLGENAAGELPASGIVWRDFTVVL